MVAEKRDFCRSHFQASVLSSKSQLSPAMPALCAPLNVHPSAVDCHFLFVLVPRDWRSGRGFYATAQLERLANYRADWFQVSSDLQETGLQQTTKNRTHFGHISGNFSHRFGEGRNWSKPSLRPTLETNRKFPTFKNNVTSMSRQCVVDIRPSIIVTF